MDRATYLKEIAAAYQGEVRGEATFVTLAEHATNEEERATWRMLARLELTTRQRLIPLLERYDLDTTPDPDQRRIGEERGKARAAAGFSVTTKSMTETLQPFLKLYARLEAEGPPEDRNELALLNAHEIALHEFATRTVAGGGRDSLAPVRALVDAGVGVRA
jgi:hypothetical protein